MTIMEVVVTALIQVVSLVYQAATATPVVSAAMETAVTGGLLQSGSNSWVRELDDGHDDVYRYNFIRNYGFSARCVRD